MTNEDITRNMLRRFIKRYRKIPKKANIKQKIKKTKIKKIRLKKKYPSRKRYYA